MNKMALFLIFLTSASQAAIINPRHKMPFIPPYDVIWLTTSLPTAIVNSTSESELPTEPYEIKLMILDEILDEPEATPITDAYAKYLGKTTEEVQQEVSEFFELEELN